MPIKQQPVRLTQLSKKDQKSFRKAIEAQMDGQHGVDTIDGQTAAEEALEKGVPYLTELLGRKVTLVRDRVRDDNSNYYCR